MSTQGKTHNVLPFGELAAVRDWVRAHWRDRDLIRKPDSEIAILAATAMNKTITPANITTVRNSLGYHRRVQGTQKSTPDVEVLRDVCRVLVEQVPNHCTPRMLEYQRNDQPAT